MGPVGLVVPFRQNSPNVGPIPSPYYMNKTTTSPHSCTSHRRAAAHRRAGGKRALRLLIFRFWVDLSIFCAPAGPRATSLMGSHNFVWCEAPPWHAPTIINVAKNGTNSFGYSFYEKSRSFVTYEMRLDSIQSFLRTSGLPKPPPGYERVKSGSPSWCFPSKTRGV